MSAGPSSPQPTAHEVVSGCTLTRRRMLQSTAIAGAAAAGVAGASGSAQADVCTSASCVVERGVRSVVSGAREGLEWGVAVNPYTAPVYFSLVNLSNVYDNINDDPTVDEVQLHHMAVNEYESLAGFEVQMNNRLVDARPVSNIEARHVIALAWEDGEDAATAHSYSLDAIRHYYEIPEFNTWHITAKSLVQLSFIAGALDELDDPWPIADVATDDDTGDGYQVVLGNERERVDVTLNTGRSVTDVDEDEVDDVLGGDLDDARVELPVLEFWDGDKYADDDSEKIGEHVIYNDDVIDSWDDDGREVTYEVDGKSLSTNLTFTVDSIGSGEDGDDPEDLASKTVFDGRQLPEFVDRIAEQSDATTANYTQDFVQDLYDELEAGTITSDQVRSPEALVHFLSGTDEPSSGRYRIALMQALGMEQPDFSTVSGMDVTYTGATGRTVLTDPNETDRRTRPTDFVEDEEYAGVLFGDGLPTDGLKAGNTYGADFPIVHGSRAGVRMLRGQNDVQWVYDDGIGDAEAVEISTDGKTVFGADDTGSVFSIDTETGDTNWRLDSENINDPSSSALSPDDSVFFLAGGNDDYDSLLYAYDADDGQILWSREDFESDPRATVFPSDGDTLIAPEYLGMIHFIDPDDGSEIDTLDHGDNIYSAVLSPDDEFLYVGGDNSDVTEIDVSDAVETGRTYSNENNADINALDIDSDGAKLYAFGNDTTRFDVESESIDWQQADTESLQQDGFLHPDENRVYCGGSGFEILDADTGDISYQGGDEASYVEAFAVRDPVIDGYIDGGIIFDESANEEISISDGLVTIDALWDADGANIEHVDDETIADIEDLDETPDDIETIVDEMDEFDSVDDIEYTRDVLTILEHYDAEDSEDDVHIVNPDWSENKYDIYDSSEWAEYHNDLEDYLIDEYGDEDDDEEDDEEDDDPLFGGLPSLPDYNGDLLGLGIVALVVLAVIGFVTDLIPGLGD